MIRRKFPPQTIETLVPRQPQDLTPGLTSNQMKFAADVSVDFQKRMLWREDPVRWCRERLHVEPSWRIQAAQSLGMTVEELDRQFPGLQDKQVEILESVRDHRKTHVRSGHQVGKTFIAACTCLWFLDCFRPSYVITTSATWTDVELKLWGAIRDLYRQAGSWFGKDPAQTSLRLGDKWWAIGLSPDRVEPFQGHNARHVLVVFDEGSSIDQKFSDAADAEATRLLEIGNPLLAQGPFYNHSRSSEYHHIQISCLDHPNIKLGKEVIPGGPRLSWVEERKRVWSFPNGPLWLGRVAGEFPEEAEDTLFPLSTIRQAFELYEKVKDLPALPNMGYQLGLDVARMGGDRTMGYAGDFVEYEHRIVHRVRPVINLPFTDHHKTRLEVMMVNKQRPFSRCNVDAGGEGSGLADELPHHNVAGVNRILFGSSPSDTDYFDARAEMHWQLSQVMKSGDYAIQRDDELEEDLSVVGGMRSLKEKLVHGTKQAVFWLPPKDDMRDVLGRSPDKSDGACLENYTSLKFMGFLDFYRSHSGVPQEDKPKPTNTIGMGKQGG